MLGKMVLLKIFTLKNSTVKIAKMPGTTTATDLYVDMNTQMTDNI